MSSTSPGAGGVRIGTGVRGTIPANQLTRAVVVADSVIEDGGHILHEGCGILMQTARDTVLTHNRIGNLYYTGISMGWTWSYTLTGGSRRQWVAVGSARVLNFLARAPPLLHARHCPHASQTMQTTRQASTTSMTLVAAIWTTWAA